MEDQNTNPDILSVDEFEIPTYRNLEIPDLEEIVNVENGPRLIISKIVIENFKSYYGVKTLGPFHKNFNAVIGPNGSGKSNIIDSILFVFGFRATKIRSKKVGVLIHNSDDHSDVQSCCVTVYFYKICNEGNREDNYYEKIDGSEFEVSRVAFKDGSSYYKLNDRKVHFKEIEDALLSAGVDLVHNRFLILQGEVEQISLMKAKAVKKGEDGLLEFLEDIIGSNRFQDPIKLVEERLTHLTELKATKLRRVKLVEKQKEELKEERNVAVEFLQLENDITKANNALIQINLLKVTEQSKEVKEALEEKSKELEDVNKKFIEVENLLKEKTKSHQEFIKKCAKVMKKKDENKEKFQRYEERDVEVQVEVKHVLSTVKKLEEKIKKEESTLEEYKQIPDKQLKELDVLEKKRKKIAEEKKEEEIKFDEVMATFQNETKDLQVDKFAKESKLLELQKTVNENKQKYQLAQGELDLALSIQNKDKNKATDVERNINRLKNIIKEKSVVLKDSEEKLPDVKASLDTATKELSLLNKSDKDRKDLIRELSVKVEVARSSFMNAQNSNKVLEFLMGLKKSGKIPAIIGRLGDLGVIDEKYDVAISTACGLLDYIVVQDMNSVQRCIEELQRADVGRASFIGLDKMAVWKKHCVEKKFFPEKAPRLFDLVRISDPALAPAFYFALRDTLVANDINQATRIAYGATRYRVVTLGGDMVELSGTISGGGKVMKGKMGSHIKEDIKPKDLNQMEQKLDEMQREAQSFLEEKYKVQQNIEALQKQHRQLNISLQMTSHEIKSLQEQVRGFEDQMNELQARIKNTKSDEMKMKMLEKNVEKLRKKYDEVQKVATGMEDEIHKIQTEIMDIGGNQFKAIETKKEALTTQHEQITTAINKLTVANKTALRKAAKSEESIVKMKGELQEATEKSISLREEKVKIEAEAHELLIYLEKIDLEVKESEGELQRISESLSEYREEERESKRILTQVSKRVEKLQEEGRQAAEKAEAIETQLRSLTLHEIDEQPKEVLEKLTSEEVNQVDKQELMRNISSASEKLQHLKPNMASIQEYKEKKELYLKRAEELLMVTNLIESNKDMHKSFKKRRLDQFMKGFSQIKMKLKEMYQTITLGGNAELEFVDTLDPFSEGIIFSVRPPKKSWKNISNLSGGEKTLSSLALIFALHQYKPTPFYVMDEIDAALDFKNASIIANYIKTQTENAQFIVISLRENTFELSDRLIGIYKTFNTTKTFAYNLSRNSKLLATCASELFADAPPDAPHVNPNTKASSPNRS